MGDAISPVLLEVIMEIELWKLGSLYGDRLSLCRYSWAKRLTVYSFIFSFLWVSFPRYSYSFVPAIAAVAARAVIPKVVGRVLVRRFAANDAIYTASQLTATRVLLAALRLMLPNTCLLPHHTK